MYSPSRDDAKRKFEVSKNSVGKTLLPLHQVRIFIGENFYKNYYKYRFYFSLENRRPSHGAFLRHFLHFMSCIATYVLC